MLNFVTSSLALLSLMVGSEATTPRKWLIEELIYSVPVRRGEIVTVCGGFVDDQYGKRIQQYSGDFFQGYFHIEIGPRAVMTGIGASMCARGRLDRKDGMSVAEETRRRAGTVIADESTPGGYWLN